MEDRRAYRNWVVPSGLVSYNVIVKETDLLICTRTNLKRKALHRVLKYRHMLEDYITLHPAFLASLVPLAQDKQAPRIIQVMLEAGCRAGVGPMAAVAGAVAEFVGRDLEEYSSEVIVENGGDIYLNGQIDRTVGIYAGLSPLSGKLGLLIQKREMPLGVCTSSGTVGHSLNFGNADAVIILSPETPLADAAATAVSNLVKHSGDIAKGLAQAQNIEGVTGAVIIKGASVGMWGSVNLVRMESG
jgi:ApbE superfamily uncharacterized protein (UPF0280 family)